MKRAARSSEKPNPSIPQFRTHTTNSAFFGQSLEQGPGPVTESDGHDLDGCTSILIEIHHQEDPGLFPVLSMRVKIASKSLSHSAFI